MKLFLIRYTKILFIQLRLHVLFKPFLGFFDNMAYLTRFSAWSADKKEIAYNDFPSNWDYFKRHAFYKHVFTAEKLDGAINYMEFGVADGASFKVWLQQNQHPDSRFYGFDTFDGLPEDFGVYKKGYFSTGFKVPGINDARGTFFTGLFQQTLPVFIKQLDATKRNVIMLDADLYSSTLFALTSLAPFLKKDDIVFFDEFVVPTHEFKAYLDFIQSYYINLELIAAANNYYFVAFKVV